MWFKYYKGYYDVRKLELELVSVGVAVSRLRLDPPCRPIPPESAIAPIVDPRMIDITVVRYSVRLFYFLLTLYHAKIIARLFCFISLC